MRIWEIYDAVQVASDGTNLVPRPAIFDKYKN